MFTPYPRPFTSSVPFLRSAQPVSFLIAEMLAEGMKLGDEGGKVPFELAMSEYCPSWYESADDDEEGNVVDETESRPRITALHGSRISWSEARPAVVEALSIALRVEDGLLNMLAIEVAAGFPDRLVGTLITEVANRDMTPSHCRRLLKAIDVNGDRLSESEAGVLAQLQNRPGFEDVWAWARMLIFERWATFENRTLTIVDLLIDGLRIDDVRLNQLCQRAMQSFGRGCDELLEVLVQGPQLADVHRDNMQAAIRWIRNRRQPSHDSQPDVVRAIVETFRIDDERINEKSLATVQLLPSQFVDALTNAASSPILRPEHCLRLLDGIECNGGTLSMQGAEILMRLSRRQDFEIVWRKAEQLLWSQWTLRRHRTHDRS